MTIQKQAEEAAHNLRKKGYRIVDNSVSYEDLNIRIKCGLWIVQKPGERRHDMTDLQIIDLDRAGRGEPEGENHERD